MADSAIFTVPLRQRKRARRSSGFVQGACLGMVIKRADIETKTRGRILISDTAGEKPREGDVVAVGPGGRDEAGKLIPIDLKTGGRVLFGKSSGTEVKIDAKELLNTKDSDITGVING